jgi:hypothetical protein
LSPDDPNASLNKLLQLERGHWVEEGIEKALKSIGSLVLPQLEIAISHQGVPIKAHLDLTLVDSASQAVTVLELKSLAKIKDEVYETHEVQLAGQIGLLARFWNDPVFRFDNQGPWSFPELAEKVLGLELPVELAVQGYVLAIAPNDARAFGPYEPDQTKLTTILDQGAELWRSWTEIQNGQGSLDQLPFREGFYPLCDYCRFNRDCPKFSGEADLNLESELTQLANLKSQKSRLESEIEDRENQLKAIAILSEKKGQWITANSYRFRVSDQKGRTSLDQELLKNNLMGTVGLDENSSKSIIALSQKTGRSFERFYLSVVN